MRNAFYQGVERGRFGRGAACVDQLPSREGGVTGVMREQDWSDALESAISRAVRGDDRDAPGLGEWSASVRVRLAGHPEVLALWERVLTGRDATEKERLARRLAGLAVRDEGVRRALAGWLGLSHDASMDPVHHTNALSDSAQVLGPSVQARDIHGGIHLHGLPARLGDRPPVPRQLPLYSANFVGREAELRALEECRASAPGGSPRLLVVSGPPGIGKTTLVTRWLAQVADEFVDGQLFADLGAYGPAGPVSPAEVLEHFLRAMGATSVPEGLAERSALWRSMTTDCRLAVLLDDGLSAAQVRPLLPASGNCLVVTTSRRQLTGLLMDGAVIHQLEALDPDAALELLARGGGGARVRENAVAARDVVRLCAYLPLAVSLAAAHLAVRPRQPLSAMAEQLADDQALFDALTVDGEDAIRAALDASYRLLSDEARALYRAAGLLPVARLDLPMVASAVGGTVAHTGPALDRLVESNLLHHLGGDVYRFHDLVRSHARERALAEEDQPERELLLRRFAEWCLAMTATAQRVLTPHHVDPEREHLHPPTALVPFTTREAALAWLGAERGTLMGVVRSSFEAGWFDLCWQLVDAMLPFFYRFRPTQEWIEAHELGAEAARRIGHRQGLSRMLITGGGGLRNAGRYEESARWYKEAAEVARANGDRLQRARALHGLGNTWIWLERLPEAREMLRGALEERAAVGYRRGVALSRVSLGEIAIRLGEYGEAMRELAEARASLEEMRETYDAARALALLGLATGLHGDRDAGEARLREAMGEFERAGSRHWQARAWEMLGEVAQTDGDRAEAGRRYRHSLSLYTPLSGRDADRLEERLAKL
ncbi:AAA family ATPase [Streptomyces sp. 3MP-14]|nr:AAA family ATPase [Streptomyces sp. 3MP-14]